jgi:Fe-S-cluster containining protein
VTTFSRPSITLTRKEAIWLACKAKRCCYEAIVVPTGRDVWRIARALDAAPWSFLVYFRTPAPARDAFVLDRSEPPFRLALAKQPSRRTKSAPPCVFLLHTRDGAHRCGLGDLRPLVCRSFPSEVVDGVLSVRNDGGCTCRRWALADVDIAEERALVEARQDDAEEYCGIVAGWNARVAAAPDGARFDFLDYCAFLMERYDALAAAPATGGEPAGEITAAPAGHVGMDVTP